MKTKVAVLILASSLLWSGLTACTNTAEQQSTLSTETSVTLDSIAIYLPPNYKTSDKEYPVIYYLPEFGDDNQLYSNVFTKELDKQFALNNTTEMIVVSINGISKLGGCFYANSPVTGNWEDFITKDVVAYIDTNYRTIKSADARGLLGHSMGGTGALSIAMHTTDLFGYVYSMSPGVFTDDGLELSPVVGDLLVDLEKTYKDLSEEAAYDEYMNYVKNLTWPADFSFSYGSAFAPDPNGKAPFVKIPKIENFKIVKDETGELYDGGFGNISEKMALYKENLQKLKGLVIEYGVFDSFQFIKEGTQEFSNQLSANYIQHELIVFYGDHQDVLIERIRKTAIPYFSNNFLNLE